MTEDKIRLRGVSKIYGPRPERALPLLAEGASKAELQRRIGLTVGTYDVDLDVPAGRTFVLMGLSGSGKSTLLRLLNRLLEATTGEILVDGVDVTRLPRLELRRFRREQFSGMVFQRFAILPHRTVIGNVEFGLELHGVPRRERRERAQRVLELVGLGGWEERRPHQLSGGMQQRVGLARALAMEGNILLMDEPFSALDPLIRRELQDDLIELQGQVRKTVVFVTHDLDEALKLGARIAIMRDGRVEQVGAPQEIVTAPASDYVRDFVASVNRAEVLTAGTIMRPLRADDPPARLTVGRNSPLRAVLELCADVQQGAPIHVAEDDAIVGIIERRAVFSALAGRPLPEEASAEASLQPGGFS